MVWRSIKIRELRMTVKRMDISTRNRTDDEGYYFPLASIDL